MLRQRISNTWRACKAAFEQGRWAYRMSASDCTCELDNVFDDISECAVHGRNTEEGVDKVIGDPENKNGGHSIVLLCESGQARPLCTCGWQSVEMIRETTARQIAEAHLFEVGAVVQATYKNNPYWNVMCSHPNKEDPEHVHTHACALEPKVTPGSADTGQLEIRKWGLAGPDVVMAGKCPHCFMGVSVVRVRKAEKGQKTQAVDIDHCPKCGEYLHDEMGHVCPDGGSGSSKSPVSQQAVKSRHEELQRLLRGTRCTVCGYQAGFHEGGPQRSVDNYNPPTCGRTVTQVLDELVEQGQSRDNGISPSSSGVQEGPSPSDTATNGNKVTSGTRKSHSKAQNGNKRGKNGAQGTDKRGKSKKTGAHTPKKAKDKKEKAHSSGYNRLRGEDVYPG